MGFGKKKSSTKKTPARVEKERRGGMMSLQNKYMDNLDDLAAGSMIEQRRMMTSKINYESYKKTLEFDNFEDRPVDAGSYGKIE